MQILGFTVMMIFGVGLRYVPAILGFREKGRPMATMIYFLFLTAVIADIAFYLLMPTHPAPLWGMGLRASSLMMLVSAILMERQLGLLGAPAEPDRSIKFIRAT